MTEITKKIRAITSLLTEPLKKAGFKRHGMDFSRQFNESLQVVNVQLSKWNSRDSGKFTLNIGVHFSDIAKLIFGSDPMPANPKEPRCLIRARVGMLMPGDGDKWWTVTAKTDEERVAEEVIAACVDCVLPWLEQFKTISNVDWKSSKKLVWHTWSEAAANILLDDCDKAAQCVEVELKRIRSESSDQKSKEEKLARLRQWAIDHGVALVREMNT